MANFQNNNNGYSFPSPSMSSPIYPQFNGVTMATTMHQHLVHFTSPSVRANTSVLNVRTPISYVPSCQQHLIIMQYSCRHCQRIDFVELPTSNRGHPGMHGLQKGTKDPDEESHDPPPPLRGGRGSLRHP